jgi:hypothetical protein
MRDTFYFITGVALLLLSSLFLYLRWTPGRDVTDGRHDLKRNGIWIQHGWLGDDIWFVKNRKKDRASYFRNPAEIQKLASLLREHNITDVFPHLCPASANGEIAGVDPVQTKLFLRIFQGFRVMPWVGGVLGVHAFPERPQWRRNFADSISRLLSMYPEFAGIHINIEPCPNDYRHFLTLLEDVHRVIPKDRIISVAAFPPKTILHPFDDVHWDKEYYRQVSKRADQMVVMMYDSAIGFEKIYQYVMADWTEEILDWSGDTQVLLGLPAYQDAGVGYHDPKIENLSHALPAIHAGLNRYNELPKNYQGISLYCEWEMNVEKWGIVESDFQAKE